jgi:hypothetical protein
MMGDPDTDREDEQVREQRWAEFVTWCRVSYSGQWNQVILLAGEIMRGGPAGEAICNGEGSEAATRLMDFAEEEGWSGVLNAIARAMRDNND